MTCSEFCAPYYLNISMWFLVQNVFGQIWHRKPYMWRVFYSYTMSCSEEKTILQPAWGFLRTNKNSHLIKHVFGATVHKICMLQGRIQPVTFGGEISIIFGSRLITGSLLEEGWSVQVCCFFHYAFTTARGMKYAVFFWKTNAVFWIVKTMVNKVTFVGFRGIHRPPGSVPGMLCMFRCAFFYISLRFCCET